MPSFETPPTLLHSRKRPWSESALRLLLHSLVVGVKESDRREILAVTGGWHQPVQEFGDLCRSAPEAWRRHLGSIWEALVQEARWLEEFEIPPQFRPVPNVIADLTAADPTTGVSAELLDGIDEACANHDLVSDALDWLDLMGYATPIPGGRLEVDPLLCRVLRPPGELG